MQNAKDSFYLALRNRLATVNAERTVWLRGVVRPGILVEEAEAFAAMLPPDVFVLRWTGLSMDTQLPAPLSAMECEIHYATDGTQSCGGLDRGRKLSEMDAEVVAVLAPPSTQKMECTQTPAVQMATMVFWTEPVFSTAIIARDRLTRVARVTVFSYQEQGEA